MTHLLFVLQIALGTVFCLSQFQHMLEHGVQTGVSVVMFLSVQAFLMINLILAVQAYKGLPRVIAIENVTTYLVWNVLWGMNTFLVAHAMTENHEILWTSSEYVALCAVLLGILLVYSAGRARGLTINDPIVRGCSALVFKAAPQLFQAWKIFVFGGSAWSVIAVLGGHITILIRLGQIGFSYLAAKKITSMELQKETMRPVIGMAISEIGNELSWLVATAFWLWWWLQ